MSEQARNKPHFTNLPEGTVTFLFTDIEGSTRLWDQNPKAMQIAVERHNTLLGEAIESHGGQVFKVIGDEFQAAFTSPLPAVGAALAAQRALVAEKWGAIGAIKVRMGIHVGPGEVVGDDYAVSHTLNRVARISAAGHGGQILLSHVVADMVRGLLPEGVNLRDMGEHAFKGLSQPEHIYQVVAPDLPQDFPPLRSITMPSPEITLGMEHARLPTFLAQEVGDVTAPVFVGRERELACLEGYLNHALAGQGGVVFITGGAGRGKTALLQAFSKQAMDDNPDLLVATGNCNAFTGVGDPYLPFREILSSLTGDVEAKWSAGTITRENATRLWKAMPETAQAIIDHGPDLVEVFIPGKDLLSRVSAAVPEQQSLLQALRALVERKRALPGELKQKALFGQYTYVLCQIAERHPILLLLDDLQWGDKASLNLLFQLGRELVGGRILVVGAYRPEEVALRKGGERHPLEEILAEFKRQYGDVWIDLSQVQEDEERRFVDELLDSEPNRLRKTFRQELFDHTEGHPLFTIELLREMQERGDLVQDQVGCWVEGKSLDWNRLPARVEGVIEARIGRLEDELREILTIASVEGEDFTAQVVARVQELSERRLLRRLSEELEKRHRLVHARGEVSIGNQILSQYHFSHALFQQFMYNGLTPGERRWLHKEIAAVLEELYAGNTAAISLQLAHHYSQANEAEKAVPYLLQAGDQARNLYAHQEAVGYYQRALAFQEGLGDYEGAARTQMKLGQTYHSAFDYRRANESYTASFGLWQRASEKRPAALLALSPHALRLCFPRYLFILDPGEAQTNLSIAIIDLLFSGMLDYTPEMDVVPDLAQRWEILEGGRKYVFHLREDAHWSDGVLVTADDFVYAWRRLLNPANQSSVPVNLYELKGARAFHLGETSEMESLGIRARDPYTLEVELEAPAGYFLQLMAYTAAYPVPLHVVEKFGKDWTEVGNLVVNGPFRIESWQHGKSMTLVRNPEYHGRFRGNLQRVEITLIPSDGWNTKLSKYEANDIDVIEISDFPPAEINRLRHQRSSEYISTPRQTIRYLQFNTSKAPFDDRRVRRALMMSVDKTRGMAASRGAAIPAMGGLIPPGTPGHSPEIGLPYDPDGARELMAQAGYPDGRGFPDVEVLIYPEAQIQLENTVLQWRELLGVGHTWEFVSFNDYQERARVKPPHVLLQGWEADYPDPDNFLRVGFNKDLSGWQWEAFDCLVESARRMQNQVKRIQLYQQADKMLIDEAIVLPLSYVVRHFLVKPWVKNYPLSPSGFWFLKDVIIEPH